MNRTRVQVLELFNGLMTWWLRTNEDWDKRMERERADFRVWQRTGGLSRRPEGLSRVPDCLSLGQ